MNDLWNPNQNTAQMDIHSVVFKTLSKVVNDDFIKFRKFYSVAKWTIKSPFHCWFCDRQINDIPVFIPQFVEPTQEHNVNYVQCEGHFCSFHCASAYIQEQCKTKREVDEKRRMLHYLFFLFYDKRVLSIPPSPPKTEMIRFGGCLTEEQYLQKIKNLEVILKKNKPDHNV